jgi:release factor glutamine methyltransferase
LEENAARLAAANARAAGLDARARFSVGKWAESVNHRFNLFLSNPPYVKTSEIAGLMPEVAKYEPARALDGGSDGLDAYRAILPVLPRLLRQGGAAILEIGSEQSDEVLALSYAAGFSDAALRSDLGGHARAVVLRAAPLQKSFGSARQDG